MSKWVQIDCRDMSWASTQRNLCRVRIGAKQGDRIEIVSTLRTLHKELRNWCQKLGDRLVRTERHGDVVVAQLRVTSCLTC